MFTFYAEWLCLLCLCCATNHRYPKMHYEQAERAQQKLKMSETSIPCKKKNNNYKIENLTKISMYKSNQSD